MNVRSEGTRWIVSEGTDEAAVSRKQISSKELIILKKTYKVPDGTILRASASGLVCFKCYDKTDCHHRRAVDERLLIHLETYDKLLEDVPGVRYKDIIDFQNSAVGCRVVLKVSPHSATLSGTADRIHSNQFIRLLAGPIPGGPYSLLVAEAKGSDSLGQPVTGSAEDLAPDSEYYYVVQVVDLEGKVLLQSEEKSFITQSYNTKVIQARDVKHTAATVECEASLVSSKQHLQVLYWEDGKEDESKIVIKKPGQNNVGQRIVATITNLKPKTTYLFSVQIYDTIKGYVLEESREWWFTTPDYIAKTFSVEDVLGSSVTAKGSADWLPSNQSLRLAYGTGKAKPQTSEVWEGLDIKDQAVVSRLVGLKDDTEYWFSTQVVNNRGTVLYESDKEFFKTPSFNLSFSKIEAKAGTATVEGTADHVDTEEDIQIIVDGSVVGNVYGHKKVGQNLRVDLKDLKSYSEYKVKLAISRGEVVSFIESTFTTQGYSPATMGAINIKDRTATLMGVADYVPPTYYGRFKWGESPDSLTEVSQLLFGTNLETQPFGFLAYGLTPNTEYYFVLEIIGSDGETVLDQSELDSFTTELQKRMRR